MKGDITLRILEHLKDNTVDGVELLKEFLLCGCNLSINKVINNNFEVNLTTLKNNVKKEDWKKVNNRFNSMLSKLEKDGLIEKIGKRAKRHFKITNTGTKKINTLRKFKKIALPSKKYKKEKSKKTSIIIFDIPEKEKRKRDWLRLAISNMGFELIQKSVWMGKVIIPVEFLKTIRDINIIEYVEIFEITKQGSLKSLK
jgi:CRISPR/Cas system-associated endoribonuclease Cas2